jgi:hypothetical protein
MIDINEAIEIINDITWQDNGRHYGKIVPVRNLAIEALKEKQQRTWISTKKELPIIPDNLINEGYTRKSVLITSQCFDMPIIAWYDIETNLFYDDYGMFGEPIKYVTAWMLLPERYKGV